MDTQLIELEKRIAKLESGMDTVKKQILPIVIGKLKKLESVAQLVENTQPASVGTDRQEQQGGKKPRRTLTYSDWVKITALTNTGMTQSAVAKELGYPLASLRLVLQWSEEKVAKMKTQEKAAGLVGKNTAPVQQDSVTTPSLPDPRDDSHATTEWQGWGRDKALWYDSNEERNTPPQLVAVQYGNGEYGIGLETDIDWATTNVDRQVVAWRGMTYARNG